MQQNQNNANNQNPRTIANRFVIKKRISAGSFGVVYLCQDKQNQEYVALKIEKDTQDEMMSLERESQILDHLKGTQGIPNIIWSGQDNHYNCLAQQLLNRDLAYYMKHFKKFTLKCIINLADQLINVIESIHKKGVIHRDIKPENILTGRELDYQQVYLVDYGVSKFYRDTKGSHMQIHQTEYYTFIFKYSPFRENKPFIGTTRYASIAAHKGHELGRKDDLESLGYMFVFLLKGSLPWQNLANVSDKDKTNVVGSIKMKLDSQELCKDLPIEFTRYFDYVKKLNYNQQPQYKYLIQLFRKLAQQQGFQDDKKFDWNEPGTITTKSSDSNQKDQTKIQHAEQQQGPSRDNQRKVQASREGGNKNQQQQVQGGNPGSRLVSVNNSKDRGSDFGSQFNSQHLDLLKLPEPKQGNRRSSRHSSAGNESQFSGASSQISSIFMNYQPSNISNKLGSKLVPRDRSSNKKSSFNSSNNGSILDGQNFHHPHLISEKIEKFQDLESPLENEKERKQKQFLEKQKKKSFVEIKIREETMSGIQEWDMGDDEDDSAQNLSQKYQIINKFTTHFKSKLIQNEILQKNQMLQKKEKKT